MSTPVVLITGALTGIGRAAAFALAREGNRVAVSGRHDDSGQALAAELRGFGGEAEFIRADVRREDDVRSLVDQTVARSARLISRRIASAFSASMRASKVPTSSASSPSVSLGNRLPSGDRADRRRAIVLDGSVSRLARGSAPGHCTA